MICLGADIKLKVFNENYAKLASVLRLGADVKLKVLNENYAKLASVLLTEKSLTYHLVKEDIINLEEEKEVLQTFKQTEAAAIVLRKIHKSLEAYDSTEKFDALMSIMEQYGGTSCLDLINEMKQELLQSTTGR